MPRRWSAARRSGPLAALPTRRKSRTRPRAAAKTKPMRWSDRNGRCWRRRQRPPSRDKKRSAAPWRRGALRVDVAELQLGRDVVERRTKVRSDQLKSSNGGNGDQSGDQAVFNRGSAIVVSEKLGYLGNHR